MKFQDITSDLLSRAIEMYLARAYPSGEIPEAVAERAKLPAAAGGAELLADERFERVPVDGALESARRFYLRLGNARYLHMKMGIDRVGETDEFVLMVDTHDQHFAKLVDSGQQAEYADMVKYNQEAQGQIEQAWTEAGLPTFRNYVQSSLKAAARGIEPAEGE